MMPSIVISERLWHKTFAGSTAAIGQRVLLNSHRGDGGQRASWRRTPFTIVGVADATFQFPGPHTDVWTAAGFVRTVNPRCCSFLPIARLKPGMTLDQAGADATDLAQAFRASNAGAYEGLRARAVGLRDELVRTVRPSLLLLLGAVGLVLFVACANVTSLLTARHAARARETPVRLALGASRGRLVALSLVESGMLVAAGNTVGVFVGAGLVETLRILEPPGVPRLDALQVDAPVLVFACVAAMLAALVTGMVPALQSADGSSPLRTGGKGVTSSPTGSGVRRALVTAEVAVSVVLLVGAILLGRSLVRLIHTDIGVVTDRVATASMSLAVDRELNGAQQIALVDRVLERMRSLPGVTLVGVGTSLPPKESRILLTLRGTNVIDYQATATPATPGYFSALGIRLLSGRFFTDGDGGNHPQVMIMSVETQRTAEIGIRMALGARPIDVVRMILREGLVLAVAGVALGMAAASVLVRSLASLLYGVVPADGPSFVAASGSMLVIALLASYIPARRATRVDPAVTLRAE
jgi:putative ABC transport system permease protein